MPFVGPAARDAPWWRQVWTVDLRQKPEKKPRTIEFEVLAEFGWTTRPPEPSSAGTPVWRADAVEHLVPRGMHTDLATVPPFLWGVVASYGRQTLPAILHDMLCYASALPEQPRAYRRAARRAADAIFRDTLRDSGSGVVRRWLMWAGVRLGGRPLVSAGFALALVVLVVLLLAGAAAATVALGLGAAVLLLVAMVAWASLERERGPGKAGGASGGHGEYGPVRFVPAAMSSLAGAIGIGVLATPVLLPVTLVTLATRFVLGIGERRLPPGFEGAVDPATGVVPEGVSARIEWVPLKPADGSVRRG